MSRVRRFALVAVISLIVPLLYTGGAAQAQATCASADHPGGDWPVFGRDLHNTRNQTAETTISPDNVGSLEPAWVFATAPVDGGNGLESTAMVSEGCAYIGTQSGSIYALNAETGELVWNAQQEAPVTTLSVANGKVFANSSIVDGPEMAAYDQFTGDLLWETVLATHRGAETTGSPTAFGDAMVMTGLSCGNVELSTDPEERLGCRGGVAILSQDTGELIELAWAIPDEDFEEGAAGGGIWSTAAVDLEEGFAYYGSGNPFSEQEHPHTNAILKLDVDPTSDTFGEFVDYYHGNMDQYLPLLGARKPVCSRTGGNVAGCEALDLDMAMAPNIFEDSDGTKMVGDGQSSGIYHAVQADTMSWVWQSLNGPPFAGGRAGGAAYDGEAIYAAGGSPGQILALDKDTGAQRWVAPTIGGTSWSPVTHANGVVYVLPNQAGASSLQAFDAATGAPLLVRPSAVDIGDVPSGTQAAGVTVARNTVFVPRNGLSSSYIVAYRLP